MLKKLSLIFALLLVPWVANAQIAGSAHDLTNTSNAVYTTDNTAGVCEFCHTPHNARTTMNAVWNRPDPGSSTSFTWGAASPTVAGTSLPVNVGASSLKCFSCHDGSTDIGALFNGTNYAMTGADVDSATGVLTNPSFVVNPSDMAGNHPVSVRFPASDNAAGTYNGTTNGAYVNSASYKTVASIEAGNTVILYTDGTTRGIECGSCHDPHSTTYEKFLRNDSAGSLICMDCHSK